MIIGNDVICWLLPKCVVRNELWRLRLVGEVVRVAPSLILVPWLLQCALFSRKWSVSNVVGSVMVLFPLFIRKDPMLSSG